MDFRINALREANEVAQQGQTPLVVGGAFFYLKQLLFELREENGLQGEVAEGELVELRKKNLAVMTDEELFACLQKIDPARALTIGEFDRYRLMRALEIVRNFGKRPSGFKFMLSLLAEKVLILALFPERATLRERVLKRLEEMLGNDGGAWLSEVKSLQGTQWEPFVKSKGFLGYGEMFKWLEEGCPVDDLEKIKQAIFTKTMKYVKRQECFWRGLCKEVFAKDQDKQVKIVELKTPVELKELMEDWGIRRRS